MKRSEEKRREEKWSGFGGVGWEGLGGFERVLGGLRKESQMLTCMRVRRQLWVQWRRSGLQQSAQIASKGAFLGRFGGGGRKGLPVFGDGGGLGFRGGAQRGYASEAGPSAAHGGKELPGKDFEGGDGGGLAGLPESPDGGRGFLVKSGVVLMAGAGTIALLGVIAASTDAFSAVPDAKERVKSSSSAVLSSGAGIGRELIKKAGNVKDASVRSFVDFVEAVASIWVLARCISTVLASSVDNASYEVASWWRPRVASFLAGEFSISGFICRDCNLHFHLLQLASCSQFSCLLPFMTF